MHPAPTRAFGSSCSLPMASLEQSMASLGIAPKCVSVVIPTRGTKPAALERAVASALGQSRPPD